MKITKILSIYAYTLGILLLSNTVYSAEKINGLEKNKPQNACKNLTIRDGIVNDFIENFKSPYAEILENCPHLQKCQSETLSTWQETKSARYWKSFLDVYERGWYGDLPIVSYIEDENIFKLMDCEEKGNILAARLKAIKGKKFEGSMYLLLVNELEGFKSQRNIVVNELEDLKSQRKKLIEKLEKTTDQNEKLIHRLNYELSMETFASEQLELSKWAEFLELQETKNKKLEEFLQKNPLKNSKISSRGDSLKEDFSSNPRKNSQWEENFSLNKTTYY